MPPMIWEVWVHFEGWYIPCAEVWHFFPLEPSLNMVITVGVNQQRVKARILFLARKEAYC